MANVNSDVKLFLEIDGELKEVMTIEHWDIKKEVLDNAEEGNPPYTYEDLIANLVRRVGRLEKQLEEVSEQSTINKRNIETFAEDFTEHKAEQGNEVDNLKEVVEMLTDDVVLLDERTQPEEQLNDINVLIEEVRRLPFHLKAEIINAERRGGGCACHRNCR